MIDEKAAKYAEAVTGDDDNLLKIYEAYQDGWIQSEPERGVGAIFLTGIVVGILFALIMLSLLKSFDIKLFA